MPLHEVTGARTSASSRSRREEFEQLALTQAPSLYRTARRLARPPDEPGDLVQETLLRAYRTFDNFTPGTNARAWLFTILYSVASNLGDKRARRPEVAVDTLDTAPASAGQAGMDEAAILGRIDAAPEIESALDELAEPFRHAVILVDIEEFSYEEAAGVMGCPVGTLRSRLFRARKSLFVSLSALARREGFLQGTNA